MLLAIRLFVISSPLNEGGQTWYTHVRSRLAKTSRDRDRLMSTPISLYNTLHGKKEVFEPADPAHVRLYVCGPTVYDYTHLGHVRCYLTYDVLVRVLRAHYAKLTYARNVTDVDDKIIKRAQELNVEPMQVAKKFELAFNEDMQALGTVAPDITPRVSDHIKEIVAMIETLIAKEAAYASQGDVYFSVRAHRDYGELSKRRVDDLEAGASGRVDDDERAKKRDPLDFALWKGCAAGDAFGWPSPWGKGRPGWHIECSAMSSKYLGPAFDIHGGGLDLVFPHHENELAQSRAASGLNTYAKYWVHNGFVEVSKEKMSKSLGNFFTARDVFDRYEPEALRFAMFTTHYRSPYNLDWTLDDQSKVSGFPQFEEAEHKVEQWYRTKARVEALTVQNGDSSQASSNEERLEVALERDLADDLNTPKAMASVIAAMKKINEELDGFRGGKQPAPERVLMMRQDLASASKWLGIGAEPAATFLARLYAKRAKRRGVEPQWIESQIAERNQARAAKDFTKADAIRKALGDRGVELMDAAGETTWRL